MIIGIAAILLFFLGLYVYGFAGGVGGITEGFGGGAGGCPNMLIQKGAKFYLYNSRKMQIPGVNPVEFDNLEDYTEYLDWQRSQGLRCPVLYLQRSYDVHGQEVYKIRPSVNDPQGGLPPAPVPGQSTPGSMIPPSTLPLTGATTANNSSNANGFNPETDIPAQAKPPLSLWDMTNPTLLVDSNRTDPPYNQNGYPGYDQSAFYLGKTTPLDMIDVRQKSAKISPNPMDTNWGGADYTQKLVDQGFYKDNEVYMAPA